MIIFLYFTTHTILHSEAPNGELKEDVERLENEKFLYFHDALCQNATLPARVTGELRKIN